MIIEVYFSANGTHSRREMASTVDRTFVISFRSVPSKLKYIDISNFIVQKLNFELHQIKHLQVTNGRVYVGTESPEVAQSMVQEHNMKHQVEFDGKLYTIPISMEDGTIEVKIHDLRPKINNQQLVNRMKEYGVVTAIREETWKDFFPGVPNGVRILRMKLLKPIPSYITVEAEMTLVTYRGQSATCKHCHRNVHFSQTCSEYAKSLKPPSVNDRLTMADVVKNVNTNHSQPDDGFIEVRRSKRKLTEAEKVKQTHTRSRSNVSLAASISSIDETTLLTQSDYQLPVDYLADPVVSLPAMETAYDLTPPPVMHQSQQRTTQTSGGKSVSPQRIASQNIGRMTRSQTRSNSSSGDRSRSPSRLRHNL